MVKIEPTSIPQVQYRSASPSAKVEHLRVSEIRLGEATAATFRAPQRPQFDIIIRVTEGAAAHSIDFVSYDAGPGDLLWIHAGQVQQWGDLDAFDGDVLLFVPEVLSPTTVRRLEQSGAWRRSLWRSGQYPDGVTALFDLIRGLDGVNRPGENDVAEHLLEALVLLVNEHGPREGAQLAQGSRLQIYDEFLRLLDAEGGVQRSVETFARALGCTPKTLNLAVRERSERTTKELVDYRLTLEAKRLLAYRSSAPIREVAEQLGFDDTSNFTKFFKRHASMTPGEFRGRN